MQAGGCGASCGSCLEVLPYIFYQCSGMTKISQFLVGGWGCHLPHWLTNAPCLTYRFQEAKVKSPTKTSHCFGTGLGPGCPQQNRGSPRLLPTTLSPRFPRFPPLFSLGLRFLHQPLFALSCLKAVPALSCPFSHCPGHWGSDSDISAPIPAPSYTTYLTSHHQPPGLGWGALSIMKGSGREDSAGSMS